MRHFGILRADKRRKIYPCTLCNRPIINKRPQAKYCGSCGDEREFSYHPEYYEKNKEKWANINEN